MPSETFYNENSQALKSASVETRNALPALAIQLLIARHADFAKMRSDKLVYELHDIIEDLQKDYEHACPQFEARISNMESMRFQKPS